MSNGQIRNLSDLCCEMKQFGKRTSQTAAMGSFATQGTLVDFSQALVLLSEEVMALRNEINELKALSLMNGEHNGYQPHPAASTGKPRKKPR